MLLSRVEVDATWKSADERESRLCEVAADGSEVDCGSGWVVKRGKRTDGQGRWMGDGLVVVMVVMVRIQVRTEEG